MEDNKNKTNKKMLAVAITVLLMSNATLRQKVVRALFQNLPGKGGQK